MTVLEHAARLIVAGGLVAALTTNCFALDVQLGDEKVNFSPSGYCVLDATGSEAEKTLILQQEAVGRGLNKFLGLLAPCAKLSDLRRSKNGKLDRYGLFVAPFNHGTLQKMEGYTRTTFLDEAERVFGEGISLDKPQMEERMKALSVNGVRQLGVLRRDSNAIYSGMLINSSTSGKTEYIAGLMAMTFIKGYAVQYTLYRPFVDKSTFVAMLNEQIKTMREFTNANQTLESRIDELPEVVPGHAGAPQPEAAQGNASQPSASPAPSRRQLDDAGDTAPSDDDRELSGWDIQIGAGIQGILIGVAAAGIVAGAFVLVWRAKNRRKTAAGDGAGGE